MKVPRILITSGEPAGVGPDLVAQIAQTVWPAELCVLGDQELLLSRAQHLRHPLTLLPFDEAAAPTVLPPGHLKCLPLALPQPCIAGQLNQANAPYVRRMLENAAALALRKTVDAVVTAPVHKAILNEAGLDFQGHTEFFAHAAAVKKAVMLFVVQGPLVKNAKNQELKVALATTHLPLAAVPKALTPATLEESLRLLQQALVTRFKLQDPVILVCGLNPHAGESGHLGREEIDIIRPALDKLRRENMQLAGPLAADTIFTEKYLKQADAILALYHDQALPVVKTLGFGRAVNMTLGLPFLRTSVDHGTALDVAGTLRADASSLEAALRLAIQLVFDG